MNVIEFNLSSEIKITYLKFLKKITELLSLFLASFITLSSCLLKN